MADDGFEYQEFADTATFLRSDNEKVVKATLSNNINIILAALDRCSTWGDEPYQALAACKYELEGLRKAYPLQKGLREMFDGLTRRLQATGGATFLTKEEVEMLREAIPCSRASW